jgi:predicted site-specific integrase-resolvase
MSKRFLWPGEVADALGVCAKTVNRWADAGAVEVIRDANGRRRYRPEAVSILAERFGLRGKHADETATAGASPDATE